MNALLRYTPGPPVCGSGKTNETLADFLRVDLDVPATPAASQKRLGPLAHNASGNRRRISRLAERSAAERRCH